jgi:HJR/Mrr/RecB family endonuclease
MFNFCPNCGNKMTLSGKFCPECGYNLQQISKKETKQVQTEKKVNIYELGEKFEQVVENIFQAKGFITARSKRLRGKSGTINEIDVLAEKGDRKVAVECKNLSSDIGQEHIRNFWVKLIELNIPKGYFATNSDFTSGARQFAQQQNITLWNRENVKENYFSIKIAS